MDLVLAGRPHRGKAVDFVEENNGRTHELESTMTSERQADNIVTIKFIRSQVIRSKVIMEALNLIHDHDTIHDTTLVLKDSQQTSKTYTSFRPEQSFS